ncbi:MAG: hypothetical protein CML06_17730 [Pseudomonadales bacterium]|nr:hypothetical protein [Pseudomonadales bacterium]
MTRTLVAFCLLWLCYPAWADSAVAETEVTETEVPPLVLGPQQAVYSLDQHVSYIADQGWSFRELQRQADSLPFIRSQPGRLSFGYVDSAYWLRVRLGNGFERDTRWVLELAGLSRAVDRIEAYLPDHQGHYQRHLAGDTVPFAARSVSHHSLLFMVNLRARTPETLYLRVQTNGSLQLPMTLWSTDAYIATEHHDTLLEGMFYGILVIMLFYNGFIFWSVKDASYLLYVCYLASVLGFALSIKGVGFEYFWPQHPHWNNKANLVFATAGVLFVLFFARGFLQTRLNTPRIHHALSVLLGSVLVCGAGVVLLSHYYAAVLLSAQYVLTVLTVILAASFALKRGFTAARYYLLAWLSVLVSILLWVLNSANVIASYWIGGYLFQIGITLQVLLFSFALADRINLLRAERESALELQLRHSRKLVDTSAMFERFVPKQFLSKIARTGIDRIELGRAEVAEVSILFADVRGFTAMAEALKPQELLNFLNAYLERIDSVIHDHEGFIDKFIGDGVMALFESESTRNGALNAVTAAIALQRAVEVYNQHRANSGYPPISIGVGVNTGEVVYGTVGSRERMDSTVLGDNVNVAARLQDLTKVLKARVLITGHTLEVLGRAHGLLVREVGDVQVRGRREPVHIYEVLSADSEPQRAAKQFTLATYRLAYENYRNRRWREAETHWQRCLELNPEDHVVQYLIRQCRERQREESRATLL